MLIDEIEKVKSKWDEAAVKVKEIYQLLEEYEKVNRDINYKILKLLEGLSTKKIILPEPIVVGDDEDYKVRVVISQRGIGIMDSYSRKAAYDLALIRLKKIFEQAGFDILIRLKKRSSQEIVKCLSERLKEIRLKDKFEAGIGETVRYIEGNEVKTVKVGKLTATMIPKGLEFQNDKGGGLHFHGCYSLFSDISEGDDAVRAFIVIEQFYDKFIRAAEEIENQIKAVIEHNRSVLEKILSEIGQYILVEML